MKSSPAALCGVSLSLAVSMYVVVRRAHLYKTVWASSSSSSSTTTTTTTTTSSKGSASSAAAGTSTSSVTKVVNGKTVTITTTTTRTVKSGSGSSSSTTSSSEQTSYFKKDDAVETARITSDQEFADGSSVKVHGHGTGKVLHYIPQSKSYKVEIHEHGKTVQKTVPLVHISHIKVKDFFIYPIKSCRGIKVDHAEITPQGIANDRTWMVVDTKGKFITQRRYAKLAVLVPKLDDLVHPTAVTLTAEGMEDLHVPIVREGHGPEVTTKVWSSDMVAIDQGDAAAKWLNKFLEDVREDREFRLVRVKDSFRRPTNPKYAPHHDTKFADAYPFLLALDASLTEVNEHLKDKIPMDRFRPNIVLTGAPAFADESWDALTIGGIVFRNVKPCDRCAVPTVDQETGVASPEGEPRKTLVPLRNGADLGFQNGSDQSYYFGSNLVAESVGQLSVGAPVKILTIKHAVYA